MARFIANVRFALLDEIDPQIGGFSRDRRMIFYANAVNFNRKVKTEEEMRTLVEYVTQLAKDLKERYNLTLVYALIPNKYTIYHDFIDEAYVYDNFIPRINKQLKDTGIPVIDIYTRYKAYRATDDSQPLYLRADTHWTPLGKSMFVNEAVAVIDALETKT